MKAVVGAADASFYGNVNLGLNLAFEGIEIAQAAATGDGREVAVQVGGAVASVAGNAIGGVAGGAGLSGFGPVSTIAGAVVGGAVFSLSLRISRRESNEISPWV